MVDRTARRRTIAFGAVVLALLILHVLDPWGGEGPRLFGLPWDLGYHLGWMALAAVAVVVMTYRVWPDEPG